MVCPRPGAAGSGGPPGGGSHKWAARPRACAGATGARHPRASDRARAAGVTGIAARPGWSGRPPAHRQPLSWGTVLRPAPGDERQDRFFCPCEVESLFQDLGFHGLAAEKSLEVAHAPFQLTHLAGPDHILVSMDGLMPAFEHPALLGEELARRDAGPTGHERDRQAGLHGLLD